MTETNYGYLKTTPLVSPIDNPPQHPEKALIAVPNSVRGESLVFTFFEPSYFEDYCRDLSCKYTHPATHETISFRMPKIFETISIIAPDSQLSEQLDRLSPYIWNMLRRGGFHAGVLVETPLGIFTNTTQTDESILEGMLRKAKSRDEIYFINESVAFVPRKDLVEISPYEFEKTPLAKALEHKIDTQAPFLNKLTKAYLGVHVRGFGEPLSVDNINGVTNPVVKVLNIRAGIERPGDEPLEITAQASSYGFGIGVLDSGQESVPNSS